MPQGWQCKLPSTPGANASLDRFLLHSPHPYSPHPSRHPGAGASPGGGDQPPSKVRRPKPLRGVRARPGRCSGTRDPRGARPRPLRARSGPQQGSRGRRRIPEGRLSAPSQQPGLERLPRAGRDLGAGTRAASSGQQVSALRPTARPARCSPGTGRPRTRAGPGGRRWWRWAGPAGPPPPSRSR